MLALFRFVLLIVSLLAAQAISGIVPFRKSGLEVWEPLRARGVSIHIASINLAHEKTGELFSVYSHGSDVGSTGSGYLTVSCIDCKTWGTVEITTTGVQEKKASWWERFKDFFKDFFKDPIETIMQHLNLDLKVDFSGTGGYFNFEIDAVIADTYKIGFYQSETILGIALDGDNFLGVVLFGELVFSLSAGVRITGGFEVLCPEGSFFVLDPLSGKLLSHDGLGHAQIDGLPVTIQAGDVTFNAALRFRLAAGTSVKFLGEQFKFDAGAIVDLVNYNAKFTSSVTCSIEIVEYISMDAGVFAEAVINVGPIDVGVQPKEFITLFSAALPTSCLRSALAISSVSTYADIIQTPVVALPVTSPAESGTTESTPTSQSSETVAVTPSRLFTLPDTPETTLALPSCAMPSNLSSTFKSYFNVTARPTATIKSALQDVATSSPYSFNGTVLLSTARPTVVIKSALQDAEVSSSQSFNSTVLLSTARPTGTIKSAVQNASNSSLHSANSTVLLSSSRSRVRLLPGNTTIASGSYSNVTFNGTGAIPMITSTLYNTELITVTRCATNLLHCPTGLQSEITITQTLDTYTTVCPVNAVITPWPSPTTSAAPVVVMPITPISPVSLLPYTLTATPAATPNSVAAQSTHTTVIGNSTTKSLPTVPVTAPPQAVPSPAKLAVIMSTAVAVPLAVTISEASLPVIAIVTTTAMPTQVLYTGEAYRETVTSLGALLWAAGWLFLFL